jgi:hypothetical protein
MLERLKTALSNMKTALVDSYVGAIALGWLFAEGITRFVSIVTEPFQSWLAQRQFWKANHFSSATPGYPFPEALSLLLMSLFLLLIAYGLLRWLYYPPQESKKKVRRRSQNLWARVP